MIGPNFMDRLKTNEFKFFNMDLIITQPGSGLTPTSFWYYFKTSSGDLDVELLPFKNDKDTARLVSYIGLNQVCEINLFVARE